MTKQLHDIIEEPAVSASHVPSETSYGLMHNSQTESVRKLQAAPVETFVCTIISKNYISASRVLMESIRSVNTKISLIVLLVDKIDGYFDPMSEPFEVLLVDDLGIPNWDHFSMKYDIMELNTAVKPYLLKYLFDTKLAQKIIYFDPDILVYSQLDTLLNLLDDHMLVLTPHIIDPLNDDRSPNEIDFLRVGTFNLGFCAISRVGNWQALLEWWQEKLYEQCTRNVNKGLFVDQHWMDLAPSLFDKVLIYRNPTYNVAYWNLKTRLLEQLDGQYTVDGQPLVFFHFSGYSVDHPEVVSRHQNRFRMVDLSDAYQSCFNDYRKRLLQAGYHTTSHWPYFYSTFSDGLPIPDMLRICLRDHDSNGTRWKNPYDLITPGNFREWANTIGAFGHSRYLTPYALTIYQERTELLSVFPNLTSSLDEEYARWFVEQQSSDSTFHPFYLDPVRRALQNKNRGQQRGKHNEGDGISSNTQTASILRLGQRMNRTINYYRHFSTNVKPFIPTHAIDFPPVVYNGPGGLYGIIRRTLHRFGVLQQVRKRVGLRTIMTVRYLFSQSGYVLPAENRPAIDPLSKDMPARIKTKNQSELLRSRHILSSQHESARLSTKSLLGVNIIGYTHSETGVGQSARNVLVAFEAASYPTSVVPVSIDDPARKQDLMANRYNRGAPHWINIIHANADLTYRVHDYLGRELYQGHYNIGYWLWELSVFPEIWQSAFDIYDEIWVPSKFIQAAVSVRSQIPVVHFPVSISATVDESSTRTTFGLPMDRFIVLFIFDAASIIERKNPMAVIKAFRLAFTAAELENKVCLVIKATRIDQFPEEAIQLQAAIDSVNGVLITSYLGRGQTTALINLCNAYISLHRSEGYGLTIAEAMALRKPVIATAYSGNMDFMTPSNSYLVPYKLIPLQHDFGLYAAGNVWADPDVETAANLLRHVFTNTEEAAMRGQQAHDTIQQLNNPVIIGKMMADRLNFIHKYSLPK